MSELVPSHRSTTTSRQPGAVVEGTVWRARRKVHRCQRCGGITFVFRNHGARWEQRDGRHVLVDCTGAEVQP